MSARSSARRSASRAESVATSVTPPRFPVLESRIAEQHRDQPADRRECGEHIGCFRKCPQDRQNLIVCVGRKAAPNSEKPSLVQHPM